MRCVSRNKQTFYYANFVRVDEVQDTDGYYTGARKPVYTEPIKCKGNISPTSGKSSANIEQFGTDFNYQSVIVLESTNMTENSIIWLDVTPNANKDNYNYIVKRVAKGLNSVAIAIAKVE